MPAAYTEVVVGAFLSPIIPPSLTLPFEPDYWRIIWMSGGGVYYSFDGLSIVGRANAGYLGYVDIPHKAKKIWLVQAGEGAVTVGLSASTNI